MNKEVTIKLTTGLEVKVKLDKLYNFIKKNKGYII